MLIPNEREQAGIALMVGLRDGGATYRQIADMLNANGITTKAGNTHWHHDSIRKILERHTA